MIPTLRIIGDVHAQVDQGDLVTRGGRTYFEIIADASYSVQVGDMGDGETYDQLKASVDADRHRFFPGNHDHYDRLPPHCLGDYGPASVGGVDFFFIRGAHSADKDRLVQLGRELGRTLWFPEEELTDEQMRAVEKDYLRVRPGIVLSHDAPTDIARMAWQNARRFGRPNPKAVFTSSRTSDFLDRLLAKHQPRLWLFGHHHRDFRHQDGETLFVCVGELSYVEITAEGRVR